LTGYPVKQEAASLLAYFDAMNEFDIPQVGVNDSIRRDGSDG
jgi:hypothetical protein